MREQRQAMLLFIVQTRIKRRRRVRDRFQILAPRHRAFAAAPQPVNETCGLGLVLEFFTPLQGALRSSAQRGLDRGPELLLVRRQFQTGMEGGNARVKESGAIGGRENMLFRLGRDVGRRLLRVAAKGAKRDAGTNNGDHGQGGRQTRFHGNSPFRLLHDPRISRDHVHLHHRSNRQGCRRLQMKLSSCSLIPKQSRAGRNSNRRQCKWRIPVNAGSRAEVHSESEISIKPGVDGGPSRPCRQGSKTTPPISAIFSPRSIGGRPRKHRHRCAGPGGRSQKSKPSPLTCRVQTAAAPVAKYIPALAHRYRRAYRRLWSAPPSALCRGSRRNANRFPGRAPAMRAPETRDGETGGREN